MPQRKLSRYDAMLGYLVRLKRDDRMGWPKALAWTIAAYRTRFPSEAAYLHLSRELERGARARIAEAARDRARARRAGPPIGLTLPPAAHLRIEAPAAPILDAIRAEWLAKHTGGASMRAKPIRPKAQPAPVSARLIRAADCQPKAPPAWSDAIAEDAPMPPIADLAEQLLDAEPGHLLPPDAVAELAEALNRRRL